MAKTFKSIEELTRHIKKNCHSSITKKIGEETETLMKDIIQEEVYDAYDPNTYERTKDLVNATKITHMEDESVEVAITDTGRWTSIDGSHFYAPYGLESGKTWGKGYTPEEPKYRPQTHIQERTDEESEELSVEIYKKEMKKKGFDVV